MSRGETFTDGLKIIVVLVICCEVNHFSGDNLKSKASPAF